MEKDLLSRVGEGTSHIAFKLYLDCWDWLAIIISIAALVIAILTFCSQRKTEHNTAPVVTMDIQKMLWLFLIKQFFYKIQYLYILKILLERCSYGKKPEESFIQSLCIAPENYIHEELFYAKEYEKHYGNVHWIIKHINDYNLYVNSIANHLDKKNIKPENIDRILSLIDNVCSSLLEHYQSVFELDKKEEFKNLLDKELFDKQRDGIIKSNIVIVPFSKEDKYSRTDAFINYFGDMDAFKSEYYAIINDYMVFLMTVKKDKIVLVDE